MGLDSQNLDRGWCGGFRTPCRRKMGCSFTPYFRYSAFLFNRFNLSGCRAKFRKVFIFIDRDFQPPPSCLSVANDSFTPNCLRSREDCERLALRRVESLAKTVCGAFVASPLGRGTLRKKKRCLKVCALSSRRDSGWVNI